MKNKLFTVFLGTYNAEPWIVDIIKSLEDQSCEPFSVVIVDNASEDNTVNILENIFDQYSFRNSYQLVKNKKNIGPISTFLDRLDIFDSEWLIMIHQDDFYHSNHISMLKNQLQKVNDATGLVFSAMQRIDENGNEFLSPPTLASKLSETDRISNFILGLQISPVNFPACALRISYLSQLDTSRHTTAFNDMELLLRLMCIADIKYIANETMHYRVYEGNAAAITTDFANDRAALVGLNEVFHSQEFSNLLEQITEEFRQQELINGLDQALKIRIKDPYLQKIGKNLLAETLIRQLKYDVKAATKFLIESFEGLDLKKEVDMVSNLKFVDNYEVVSISGKGATPLNTGELDSIQNSLKVKKAKRLSLSAREKIYNFIFNSFIFALVKRPFVKVWRSANK